MNCVEGESKSLNWPGTPPNVLESNVYCKLRTDLTVLNCFMSISLALHGASELLERRLNIITTKL